ncbi:hypothetical protein IFM89_010650, partial [Coptis chinensis]
MDKEDPSRKHGRVDSWKKGHERRGWNYISGQTHYALLQSPTLHPILKLKGEMNEMKSSLSNVIGVLK